MMDNERPALEEMREAFEHIAICAEPVYTLAECLSAAPDDDGGFDLGADRVSAIKERFRTTLYLCDKEQLDFIRFVAELSASRATLDRVIYYPLHAFAHNGFLFVFSSGGGHYLVLPDELAAIFHEVIADADFAQVNAARLELKMYAGALINLYGAYEIEQYVDVWNRHHRGKISRGEAEEFLSDMANFHSDYYFIDNFIVHDCLYEDDFDDLWDKTHDKDYYPPTKSVIREYASRGHGSDEKSPDEREMDEFLAGKVKLDGENDLDDIQWEIKNACERLKSPAEIRKMLAEWDFPLDDETAVSQFERLYNRLRNNAHIWELRGFTPHQYEAHTGENIMRFELPKNKKKRSG